MLTQCPSCHTLFRIRGEQLQAADGQARCCRCNQVFDALANLREEPAPVQRPPRASQWSSRARGGSLTARRPAPEGLGTAREESATGTDEAAAFAGATESPPSLSPPEADSEPTPSPADPLPEATDAMHVPPEPAAAAPSQAWPTAPTQKDVPFEIPEDLPEIKASDESKLASWDEDDEPDPGPSLGSRLGWGLGALLLLGCAVGQFLWWDRDALAQSPQGRRIVEPFCQILGCRIPPRRALDRIRVLSRDVSPHPTEHQALLIMLVMANEASFAQPFPLLQLTLFDDKERPVGQRRFTPREYLRETDVPLMKPDQAVYVRLELVDPGTSVTGFRFEFL